MTSTFTPEWLEAHRVDASTLRRDEVVGIGHVLTELDGLVARLRNPAAAAAFGLTVPRGLLFWGPPGVGKTLSARYLASRLGDDIPFYEVSADELTPDRIRGSLRYLADVHPQSVLYADEIDLIGMTRDYGGHDTATRERLTALLAALDGLQPSEGPVVIAATNRAPGQLSEALTRSGRLGTLVRFDRPSEVERIELLRVFARRLPLAPAIDFRHLARLTRGTTPADLRQTVEDAAGLAFAAARDAVGAEDLLHAIRRGGRVEPEPLDSADVRRRIAVHESGHVAIGVALRGPEYVYSVSIGVTDGLTSHGDERVPAHMRPDDVARDALVIAFGGTASERLVLGEPGTGGAQDVAGATAIALRRIQAGLTATVPIDLGQLGRSVAASLKAEVADDLRDQLRSAREAACAIVAENLAPIRYFAERLEKAGVLTGDELQAAVRDAAFVGAADVVSAAGTAIVRPR